jgi:hypothetical protein
LRRDRLVAGQKRRLRRVFAAFALYSRRIKAHVKITVELIRFNENVLSTTFGVEPFYSSANIGLVWNCIRG